MPSVVTTLALALTTAAAAAHAPLAYPPGELARGTRGTCYTVFVGDTVEPFDFEVRGLMRDYLGPGRHLVVARLLGEQATFTGVVAGMSGSPCMVEGRLLGALAYAFAPFAKEPIAGIVPIEDMREIMTLPPARRPARLVAAGTARAGDAAAEAAGGDLGSMPAAAAGGGPWPADGPTPLATPLAISGVPAPIRARFAPWLEAAGFVPVAGAGAAAAAGRGTAAGTGGHAAADGRGATGGALVPGGAVAAVLVRGDVDMAATGTVTAVDGTTVLAFGHPFLGAGALSLPMAQASIVHTMVSAQRSFKMAATGATVGEFTQDRLTAIGGSLGPGPRMVPVRGRIATPRGTRPFAFEVARDPELTPRLLAMALAGALSGRADVGERGTVRLAATVTMGCLPPQHVAGVFAAERDEALLAGPALEVARHFAALWHTPFAPPPDASVCVEVMLADEPFEEAVVALAVDRATVRPGEPLTLAVRLRRRDAADVTVAVPLTPPRPWAGQEVALWAGGQAMAEELAHRCGGGPEPQTLADVARALAARRADGALYVMATRAGTGLHAASVDHAFLPPSAVVLGAGAPGRRRLTEGLAWEVRTPRPGTVAGRAQAQLSVLPR